MVVVLLGVVESYYILALCALELELQIDVPLMTAYQLADPLELFVSDSLHLVLGQIAKRLKIG